MLLLLEVCYALLFDGSNSYLSTTFVVALQTHLALRLFVVCVCVCACVLSFIECWAGFLALSPLGLGYVNFRSEYSLLSVFVYFSTARVK